MENCDYNGQRICALDLRSEDGILNEDLKRRWRSAGHAGELVCEDCGMPVYLGAGALFAPYFTHRRGLAGPDCYFERYREMEEPKRARRLLYYYFKKRYPAATVQTGQKLLDGRRTDIYVEQGDKKLAVGFQWYGLSLQDRDAMHEGYVKLGIADLWLISPHFRAGRITDFSAQVLGRETGDHTVKFLDVSREEIIFARIMEGQVFRGSCQLDDVTIRLDGKIESNFDQQYDQARAEFIEGLRQAIERVPPYLLPYSEFNDAGAVEAVIERLQRIWKYAGGVKDNQEFAGLVLKCQQLIQGYRSGFLSVRNWERLEQHVGALEGMMGEGDEEELHREK